MPVVPHDRYRRLVPKIVALLLVVVFLGAARLPRLSDQERRALASQFVFERMPLGPQPEQARSIRSVHPALRRIAAWISSVGSSVALTDVDGDGLSNDFCLVDPRQDEVIVGPLPGGAERYPSFTISGSSVDHVTAPMGCRFGDFNEDGLADIVVYYWGRTPLLFLRRAPEPGQRLAAPSRAEFSEVDILPGQARWNTNALTTADIDGDGHVDLIVGNYFPDGADLLDARATTPFDMQESMARAFNGGTKHILLWEGATTGRDPLVRFKEASTGLPSEILRGWTLAVGAADLDGDLLPELYFANDFGPDRLLYNESRPGAVRLIPVEGRKTFTMPNSKVLGRDSFKGMGVDFGDLNGDGVPDIFVSNIANEHALEESHFAFMSVAGDARSTLKRGVAPYIDSSEDIGLSRSGFSWEARLADFNNDGILEALQADGFVRGSIDRWAELQELAMGNNLTIKDPSHWPHFEANDDISGHLHNPFFVRSASGRYFDLAPDIGLGHPQVARGIADADVDGDGRLDFAVARQWETSDFYQNVARDIGASLELRLLVPVDRPALPPADGTRAGRPAIGATVRLTRPDGRRLVAQVDGGNGHSGGRAPELHFGLGRVVPGSPLVAEISWRDANGTVQRETRTFAADPPPDVVPSRGRSRIQVIMLDRSTAGR